MADPQTVPATITLTCNVDKQTLFYLFSTALEGGIGYWSVCSTYHWRLPSGDYDLDGFYADVEETETDEEPEVRRIDASTIVKGLLYFAQPGEGYRHVRQVARAVLMGDDDVDYDACDADCIVQAGLLGEVVYG